MRSLLLLPLVALLSVGCAGYRLGPTNGQPAGSQSVEVQSFQNKTLEPRLTDAVISALRQQIQKDATYKLSTQGDSDIVVSGVIKGYRRHEISFNRSDVLTVRDYSIVMTARVTARDRLTDKIILDQDVKGRTTVRADTDLLSAERQALPLLAEDLARNIADKLADGTW